MQNKDTCDGSFSIGGGVTNDATKVVRFSEIRSDLVSGVVRLNSMFLDLLDGFYSFGMLFETIKIDDKGEIDFYLKGEYESPDESLYVILSNSVIVRFPRERILILIGCKLADKSIKFYSLTDLMPGILDE